MLRSELAEDLGTSPSTVRKWLKVHTELTGQAAESRLDDLTVSNMRRARELTLETPTMVFREALERVLGCYVAPIPAASVVQMLGRLDTLDSTLSRLEVQQAELHAAQEAMTVRLETLVERFRELLLRRSGTAEPTSGSGG